MTDKEGKVKIAYHISVNTEMELYTGGSYLLHSVKGALRLRLYL